MGNPDQLLTVMRILLVEDDALLADGLARALSHSGYVVEIAGDGKSADCWIEGGTFDLVILDTFFSQINRARCCLFSSRRRHTR